MSSSTPTEIMRASRFHAAHDIRLESLPIPEPSPSQVLIKVEWCGICGTDLHEYTLGPLVIPRPSRPHSITKESIPVTLGHEFTGHIVKTGSRSQNTEVGGLEIGQAVIVDPRLNCNKANISCFACNSASASNLCSQWGFVGLSGGGGGFSEYVAVEKRMCHALPASVPLDAATLIEPLTVGRHGLSISGIKDFSSLTVLVVGGGPIGLSVLWNLKAIGGAKNIIVSEPTELRQRHCAELADHVFSPLTANVPEECRALTSGAGVDIVFDCAGIPAGLKTGMDALRPKGNWVNVAGWEVPLEIPLRFAMMKELDIKFSMAYDEKDFGAVVEDFVSGKFEGVEKMITGRIGIENLVEKGFEDLIRNKDKHVKIVATPRSQETSG